MGVRLATRTLEAINAAVERDQGSAYRGLLGKIIPTMDDAYRTDEGGFRSHLGVSMIGEECTRKLFYNWRWATKPCFNAKTIRLFNRGHLEEARFMALLMAAGMQVYQQDENGKQFRVSYANGHYGSAIDGVVIGCPDLPEGQACLVEMKTHNQKSFDKLVKEGMRISKGEHFTQMQVYKRYYQLTVGLYIAVNKNTDELYAELVNLEPEYADMYIDRGIKIVFMEEPPKGISEDNAFWKCKWCDHNAVCHRGVAPEINCRTCTYSRPNEDGNWYCAFGQQSNPMSYPVQIDKERQESACPMYARAWYYGDK